MRTEQVRDEDVLLLEEPLAKASLELIHGARNRTVGRKRFRDANVGSAGDDHAFAVVAVSGSALAEIQAGADEVAEHRVRVGRSGLQLRMELARHEERMVRQL